MQLSLCPVEFCSHHFPPSPTLPVDNTCLQQNRPAEHKQMQIWKSGLLRELSNNPSTITTTAFFCALLHPALFLRFFCKEISLMLFSELFFFRYHHHVLTSLKECSFPLFPFLCVLVTTQPSAYEISLAVYPVNKILIKSNQPLLPPSVFFHIYPAT